MNIKNYIYLSGGLGNQLYMLAYAFLLREQGYQNVCLLTTQKEKGDTLNTQKRNIYNIIIDELGFELKYISPIFFKIIKRIDKLPFYETIIKKIMCIHNEPTNQWATYHPLPVFLGYYNFHIGYYQSCQYQQKKYIERIRAIIHSSDSLQVKENDVAIHIRRGDFLLGKNTSIFSVIDVHYYLKSIDYLEKYIKINKLYIFTDDINSIHTDVNEFSKKYKIQIVQGNSVLEDLQFLTQFSNYILGNSTFAWWGAKLSRDLNPKVIVPSSPWKIHMKEKNPYPQDWIVIDN